MERARWISAESTCSGAMYSDRVSADSALMVPNPFRTRRPAIFTLPDAFLCKNFEPSRIGRISAHFRRSHPIDAPLAASSQSWLVGVCRKRGHLTRRWPSTSLRSHCRPTSLYRTRTRILTAGAREIASSLFPATGPRLHRPPSGSGFCAMRCSPTRAASRTT